MLAKRIFDIVFSIIGIIILSPVFIIITLLIKIITPGPVFFSQYRTGQKGRLFKIYKFRTMILNHGGDSITIKNESRITPLGVVLRNYKLDELPELLNIVKGDMSFVGPRPDTPEYTMLLAGEDRKILEIRPGITGPATLKYANEEELLASSGDPKRYNDEVLWPDKVKINLNYYYNRSFAGDIALIFRTITRRFTKGNRRIDLLSN
jgi:lipopolysaccharide/colanic/teichoic acid biosynthesis glycosyltransferase